MGRFLRNEEGYKIGHNRLISMVMEALTNVFIEILSKIPTTLEDAKVDLEYCI